MDKFEYVEIKNHNILNNEALAACFVKNLYVIDFLEENYCGKTVNKGIIDKIL